MISSAGEVIIFNPDYYQAATKQRVLMMIIKQRMKMKVMMMTVMMMIIFSPLFSCGVNSFSSLTSCTEIIFFVNLIASTYPGFTSPSIFTWSLCWHLHSCCDPIILSHLQLYSSSATTCGATTWLKFSSCGTTSSLSLRMSPLSTEAPTVEIWKFNIPHT